MKGRMMPNLSEEQKIEKFRDILFSSEYVVFLGGAGVSTESGIPDFRSKNGLYHQKDKRYSKYRPEYLLSYDCLKHEPKIFFEYYRKNLDARDIKPNAAHLKLAEMENTGRLKGIVTQNIDGLHQKAGSINLQEIHGTIWKNHCISCGTEYDSDFIFDSKDDIPICPKCGKMVRPDVVLYGEFLPDVAYQNSIDMMNKADCLIIGGTSLEVGSASQLAHIFHGQHIVIINKGKTKLEGKADVVFHESIGKILSLL
jgi:NAD-dependent deacetylase